jgi:NodT family efflux transporter outer membrane factor (OMF) lipoprotein
VVQLAVPDAILMKPTLQLRPPSTWLVAAVLGLAASLSGCLSKAPPHASILRDSLPKNTQIPAAWTAASGVDGAVTDDWLKSFHDPNLDAVVAEAIAHNLDLAQAAAQVEMARQNVVVVASQLKPQIGLGLVVATTRDKSQDQNYTSSGERFGIAWEPDIWGRLRAQRAAANASFQATSLDYAWARQSLAATASKAWYQAVELRSLLAVTGKAVNVYKELLRISKVKQAAGQVGGLDVTEAAARVELAQSALTTVQALFIAAQRNLEVLLGRYPAAAVDISREFVPLPPAVPAGLPSSLLERRPDILGAERLVLASFRNLEAARLARLPTFSLDFDGGRLSDSLLSLLKLNPWFYHVPLGMTVPVYTGGRLSAEVKIETAQQQQAMAHYGAVVLNAFDEAETALTNENLYAQQFQHLESSFEEYSDSVRIATIKYIAGSYDMQQVLQLETSQLSVESDVITVQNARLANCINLHLALGGSFEAAPAVPPISR